MAIAKLFALNAKKRLSLTLSRKQMLTIYKTRSHLDYAGIIYDKHFNESFEEKLEKFQYSAGLSCYWSNRRQFSGTFALRNGS